MLFGVNDLVLLLFVLILVLYELLCEYCMGTNENTSNEVQWVPRQVTFIAS